MKILSRLLNNCRESDRQIGRKVGISGGAASARIRKMEGSGVIERFAVKVEPPVFGYGVLYIVVSGQNINGILRQLSLVGEPFFAVPCVGGITVCSIVIKDEMQQKIELVSRLMKDVRVLTIFEAENPTHDTSLTRTDLEILEELMIHPRQKIEEISNSTNLSTKTVTRCIEKLHGHDGVQFTLVYDPTKIEDFIPHVILASIGNKTKNTLAILEKEFSESFLQMPFIAKNQIVLFMYSRNIFRMDDLTQKVTSVENVKSTDLFIPKKISLLEDWLKNAIKDARKSPKLHITYRQAG